MAIFLLALIGTLIVMAILCIGRFGFGRKEVFNRTKFIRWFFSYFIFNYLFSLFILYFSMPALTGPFGGWQWVLWPLVLSCIGCLFAFLQSARNVVAEASQGRVRSVSSLSMNSSRGSVAAGIFGLVIAALVGIVISGLIVIFTTWFDVNAKALAAIPNIKIEASPKLPPTDPGNIVLVSQSVAVYKGQQVLGSNGQNLGSTYHIEPDSYTLQSINHHLYYVGPLTYNNIFVNLSNPTTPGFVVVDAEDPQQVPQLHTGGGDSLAYLPGALLNQDLLRHVYLSGYTYGKLVDPTLELDDTFHPYWTISLMQPSRGYTGDVLSEVLIVDAHTGNIKKYRPQDVPAWVDRVMPADTVNQYLEWWGLYHNAPWFNPSGEQQQTPASDPELLYNNIDQPVWLIPMTSNSSNDQSSTGVFLFDTHKNEGHFYPLSGLGIGSNISSTIKSTRQNIRGYDVASIQLYQIYNTPTWVAIFVQSSCQGQSASQSSQSSQNDNQSVCTSGDIYQGVGLVDARNLNGSNVQFEPTLSQALQDYQQWLTQQGAGGNTPTNGQTQTVQGTVERISSVQQGSNTIYYIQIKGQSVIFTANLSLSPKLPLVQPGDIIKGDYLSTGTTVVNFKTFDDLTINLGGTPTPGTGLTPTPGVTPTTKP